MRITNNLKANSLISNLNANMNRVFKYEEQLSSLKEVNRPSDDPLALAKILDLQAGIKQNREYKNTISDAIDWTNVQDASLANATQSLQRVYTLIQQAGSDSYNADDRQAIKSEILSEVDTFLDSLNTNFGGKYIFAGKETQTKPFEATYDEEGNFTGIAYHGTMDENDNGNLAKEISRGVTVNMRTDGRALYNEGSEGNIGDFFSDVIQALDSNDTEELRALRGPLLERADTEMNNVVQYRTEIGAIHNRLTAAHDRNDSEHLNLQSTLSNIQDVELAEKFMQYSMEMVAYEASLSMGARVLSTNLLNYL